MKGAIWARKAACLMSGRSTQSWSLVVLVLFVVLLLLAAGEEEDEEDEP